MFFVLSGCSALKASPNKLLYFVPSPEHLAEVRTRAPFHLYWVSNSTEYYLQKKKYGKVFVSPVNIDKVNDLHSRKIKNFLARTLRIEESEELARYFEQKLRLELQNREGKFLIIVDEKENETVQVNLALINIVPTSPAINLVGTVAGFFIPGGGLASYFGEGSVAMEGFVEDSGTGEIYEKFADREGQKTAPFSLKDYQRYAHIREVIDDWAMQIAELLNTPAEHTVEDSLPVSLKPY